MRIKETIHFSPQFPIQKIDFDNRDLLVDAFEDRFNNYYLKPCSLLNDAECAFAAGALLLNTIDGVTLFTEVGAVSTRIENFCKQIPTIKEKGEKYSKDFAQKINDDFRNGLIHEGRIKNGGQFSYDYRTLDKFEDGCLVVNPRYFQDEVDQYIKVLVKRLRDSKLTFDMFKQRFKAAFELEIVVLRE